MAANKAKLLDWLRKDIAEHNSWSPDKWELTANFIKKRNHELAKYRDWLNAMNAFGRGGDSYIPELHGPSIARMYGSGRPAFKSWREQGYPMLPEIPEGELGYGHGVRDIMYNEYYPTERMEDISFPESRQYLDDADWAEPPNSRQFERRKRLLDKWYDINFIDPMDLR